MRMVNRLRMGTSHPCPRLRQGGWCCAFVVHVLHCRSLCTRIVRLTILEHERQSHGINRKTQSHPLLLFIAFTPTVTRAWVSSQAVTAKQSMTCPSPPPMACQCLCLASPNSQYHPPVRFRVRLCIKNDLSVLMPLCSYIWCLCKPAMRML